MSEANDISQIRSLIFGETISEYNKRFEALTQSIDSVNSKLDQFIADQQKLKQEQDKGAQSLGDNIASSVANIEQAITALKDEINNKFDKMHSDKTGREDLSALLGEMADKLSNSGEK